MPIGSLCAQPTLGKTKSAIAERVAKLDGGTISPAFAQLVGGHSLTTQEQAIRILTAAQAAHPSHFGLAMETAKRFANHHLDEKITYCRVALAIHPLKAICYSNLGVAALSKEGPQRGRRRVESGDSAGSEL